MIRGELYVCGQDVVELEDYTDTMVSVIKYGGDVEFMTRPYFESNYRFVYDV